MDEATAQADIKLQPKYQGYGGQSMIAPLRRVLVRRPSPATAPDDWRRFNYPAPTDDMLALAEHKVFRDLLHDHGVEVLDFGGADNGELDAIFTYDPSFTTDEGVILCRPGKVARRSEVELARQAYRELDIPILGEIEEPGTLEGGDMCWLDAHTLAVGEGYRTNAEGIHQLTVFLRPLGVDVVTVGLPYWHGPDECLHLLSLISPVNHKQAVVYLPLLMTSFVEFLKALEWELIPIPDHEFATQGCNVLALAPGKVLMLKDNPVTKQRLEAAGCEVLTYAGDEISHKRAGGPTCLTRPILRDVAIADAEM